MIATGSESSPFGEIRDLNRAFLTYLKLCIAERADCLGLPAAARHLLKACDTATLDAVADLPRALFKVDLDADRAPVSQIRDPVPAQLDSAHRAIRVTIAFGVWNLCRQSVYQARFLLALDSRSIQRLRSVPIGDVHRLADAPRLVSCAFPTREWLWTDLLTETRPEARRRLLLVALQPRLESEWPRRTVNLHR